MKDKELAIEFIKENLGKRYMFREKDYCTIVGYYFFKETTYITINMDRDNNREEDYKSIKIFTNLGKQTDFLVFDVKEFKKDNSRFIKL